MSGAHFMTITRFVTRALNWLDEGAPEVDRAEPAESPIPTEPDLETLAETVQ